MHTSSPLVGRLGTPRLTPLSFFYVLGLRRDILGCLNQEALAKQDVRRERQRRAVTGSGNAIGEASVDGPGHKYGSRSARRQRTMVLRRSAKLVRLTCETTALSVTTMSQYGSVEPIASMS